MNIERAHRPPGVSPLCVFATDKEIVTKCEPAGKNGFANPDSVEDLQGQRIQSPTAMVVVKNQGTIGPDSVNSFSVTVAIITSSISSILPCKRHLYFQQLSFRDKYLNPRCRPLLDNTSITSLCLYSTLSSFNQARLWVTSTRRVYIRDVVLGMLATCGCV